MMQLPEHYAADVLFFFAGKDVELSLYQALFRRMEERFPDSSVKVQKSQISFYGRHLFASASLPIRRRKDWPERCLVVTLGLPCRLDSPRVAVAVEPYPGRWTHHILLTCPAELDGQLMNWLQEAYDFSQRKR